MKNVFKRGLNLLTLFSSNNENITTDFIKDNILDYRELGDSAFIPESVATLNSFISVAAFVVGFAQVLFIYNLISSLRNGQLAGHNPWRATTLEWQTPQTPPGHGNFDELPLVYRWPYDYSVPGAPEDFLAQNDPGQGPVK